MDLDYFDRQDLGRLRRKIRNAVQGYRRERELYLEIVGQYFQVTPMRCLQTSRRSVWRPWRLLCEV